MTCLIASTTCLVTYAHWTWRVSLSENLFKTPACPKNNPHGLTLPHLKPVGYQLDIPPTIYWLYPPTHLLGIRISHLFGIFTHHLLGIPPNTYWVSPTVTCSLSPPIIYWVSPPTIYWVFPPTAFWVIPTYHFLGNPTDYLLGMSTCTRKKAGLRTLHDLGPEIRRAISGNLDDDFDFREEEPMHRVILRVKLICVWYR